MQVNETFVRSVVEEVLQRLGGNGAGPAIASPAARTGRFGLFTSADEAVSAFADTFRDLKVIFGKRAMSSTLSLSMTRWTSGTSPGGSPFPVTFRLAALMSSCTVEREGSSGSKATAPVTWGVAMEVPLYAP